MRRTNPARSTTATTAPTAIPAIAPPDSFFFKLDAPAVPDAEADVEEVGDAVGELVENVMKAVIVGNTTPAHLWSALELKQHVFVLF